MSSASGEGGAGGAGGDKKRQGFRQSYDKDIHLVMQAADLANARLKETLQLQEKLLSVQEELAKAKQRHSIEVERADACKKRLDGETERANQAEVKLGEETKRADQAEAKLAKAQADAVKWKGHHDGAQMSWDQWNTRLQKEHDDTQRVLQTEAQVAETKIKWLEAQVDSLNAQVQCLQKQSQPPAAIRNNARAESLSDDDEVIDMTDVRKQQATRQARPLVPAFNAAPAKVAVPAKRTRDAGADEAGGAASKRKHKEDGASNASGALTGRVGVLTGLFEGAKSVANMLQAAPVRQSGPAAGSAAGSASETGSANMQVDQISVPVLTASNAGGAKAKQSTNGEPSKELTASNAGGAKAKQSTKGEPSKEPAFNDATGEWHPEVLESLRGCVSPDKKKVEVPNNRFKVKDVDYTKVEHDDVEYQELDDAALKALKKQPYEMCLVALGKVCREKDEIRKLSAFMVKNIDYLRMQWGLDDEQSSSSEGNTESDSDSDEEEKASSASGGAGGAARDDALAAPVQKKAAIQREPGEVYVMSVDELTVKYTVDPTQQDPANLPRSGYVDMVCSKQNVTVPAKVCWGCFSVLGRDKAKLDDPKATCRQCNIQACKTNRKAFLARRAAAKKANAEQVPARDPFPFEDPV